MQGDNTRDCDAGRYGERDRQWIRLRDPDANHYPDDGFYAIWSRSKKRLLVSITTDRLSDDLAQVALVSERAIRLRMFLADIPPAAPTDEAIRLDDADESTGRCLNATWSRSTTRLIITVTSPHREVPIGEVDLHLDQAARLRRFLAAHTPSSTS